MSTSPVQPATPTSQPATSWTFLSNHAHVLVFLSRTPDARLRDVAAAVGITERAVQRIIADLEHASLIEAVRIGRRNSYNIFPAQPLRHPIEAHRSVADLLALFRA